MNRLGRKEFKNLLIEWNNNLLSERGKYTYLVKKDAVKPCTIIILNYDQGKSLKDFLKENNQIKILQDVSTTNLGFGKIIPNNEDTRNMLIDFFNQSKNEEIANQIINANINEPIIIASAAGNNLSLGSSNDSDIFYWLVHDLEHIIYGKDSILGEYYKGWSSWEGANEDYSIEIMNVKAGYPEDNELDESQMEGLLNHLALDKFFSEIKFTEGVGANDFPASVFAYCITKMNKKDDFNQINDAVSLEIDEKDRLKSIFSSAYESVNGQIDLLIKKLEKKIFVCLDF